VEISRRALRGIILGALLVILLVAWIAWHVARRPMQQEANAPGMGGGTSEQSKTRLAVPAGTAVPELGSNVAANVAKPEMVLSQPGGFKYRSFDITVQHDAFTPNTVIVNAGDDVYITFLAVDKDYDFKQPDTGFANTLPKGQKKVLHGQFPAPGKFILYCESCGGPDKGPVAYIVVVPK
jgi:plastocyanin